MDFQNVSTMSGDRKVVLACALPSPMGRRVEKEGLIFAGACARVYQRVGEGETDTCSVVRA